MINKINPVVNKSTLIFLAGFLWLGVGSLLLRLAFSWLHAIPLHGAVLFAGIGIGAGLLVHHLGFLRIVDRNLERILPMEGKRSVFYFMPWKSYGMVIVMAAMGAALRHSRLPKPYLATVYIGIGLALALSSIRYFRFFVRELNRNE